MNRNKLTILSLFAITLFAGLFPLQKAEAAWLSGWSNRRAITIDNTAGSALTNYQVSVDTTNSIYNENGLVGSWHLNDGTGLMADDSSGGGNVGSLVAGATLINPKWVAGKFGSALNFDGVDDYVLIPSNLGITNGDITISVWVKPTNATLATDHPAVVSHYDDSTKVDYRIFQGATGIGIARHRPGVVWDETAQTPVTAGQWYYATLVYSGTNLSFYLNGVFQRSVVVSGSGNTSYATQTLIGRGGIGSTAYFAGTVDELRIYSRALSISEISNLYNNTKARLDYGDVRFTDSDGSTLIHHWRENDKKSWVEVPSISASSQKTIYMYYGNSSAANTIGATMYISGGYVYQTYKTSGVFIPPVSGTIDVYAWGGGGAGGTPGGWVYGATGGAGGAARGTMSVTAGSAYPIVVGGGGGVNSYGAGALSCVDGGGACASWNNTDNRYGGGGGGFSGIFASSVTQANARLIAGGGGGGGSSRAGTGNVGGAGGGSTGENGTSAYDGKTAYRGLGGSQSAAGADATCDGVNTTGGQGALQGGRSRVNAYGGGGGGGYWGGSGGGYSESNTMAGGGGGSSFYNATYVSSAVLTGGTGTTPGDSTNTLRGTAGTAGAISTAGTSGIVIIRYLLSSDLGMALATASSGEDTFDFFDDFSGNSINTTKWSAPGTANTTPLSGVISNWKLNELSGTTAADSTSGYTGTTVGTPSFTTGMIGNGLSLSNGQYITVPNQTALNITGDLTIAMWVKPNSVTCSGADPAYVLVSKRNSNIQVPYEFMIGCGGSLRYAAWGTNIQWPGAGTANGVVTTGAWQHVAMVRSYSGITATVTFYVNGVNVGSSSQDSGPTLTNSDALWISRGGYNTAYTNEGSYSGMMDEIQIYNRALSASEIYQVYGTPSNLSVNGTELKGVNTTDRITSTYTFSDGVIQEVKSRYVTHPTNGFMTAGFYISSSNHFGYLQHPGTNYYEYNGTITALAGTIPPASTSYLSKITVKSASVVDFLTSNYSTGITYQSVSDVSNVVSAEPIVFGRRYDGDSWNGQAYEAYWDWVRIRKYTAVEPVTSVYGEQNNLTFTKRRAITIDNTANSSALYDYQVPIDITEAAYSNHGLIGSWHLNELVSNGAADSSGNNYHGTAVGAVGIVSGKYGNAASFNGSSYISAGSLGAFPVQGTLSFWMNASVMANYNNPLATKLDGSNVGIRFEENASGTFGTLVGNDAGTYTGGTYIASGMQTNTWYHVVLEWNTAQSNITGYLNGVQVFSNANTYWPSTISNFAIGSGFDASRRWRGLIDEVLLYNRVLSPSEIADQYASAKARLDYADIRFTDSTSYTDNSNWTASYSYWLESDKKAWVKIPSIAANTQKTIYMYYGNLGAASQSNGDNTFNFFDDFNSNLNKWTVRAGMSLINGELDLPSNTTSDSTPTFSNAYFGTSYIYDAKIKSVSGTRLQPIPVYLSDGGGGSTMVRYISDLGSSVMYESHTWGVNNSLGYNGGVNNAFWHNWTMIRKPTTVILKVDNLPVGTEITTLAGYNVTSRIGISAYVTAAKYDDVRIRKYSAVEPTTSLYAEQNNIIFTKRRAITIDNTTNSSTLYNYQVPVDLTTAFYNNTGLVGSWHFSDGAGVISSDFSGNNNHGTLVGNPSWVDGKYGNGLTLNGTSQYVNIPASNSLNLGTGDFAISLWFNAPDQTTAYPALVSTQGGWNAGAFALRYDNTGYASKVGVYLNPGDPLFASTNTFSNNAWHHVVLTRSGTKMSLYVDNSLEGTADSSLPVNLGYGGAMRMGWGTWDGANGYFKGTLDEFMVYSRALSISEISDIYNGSKARLDLADIRFTDDAANYSEQSWITSYSYWLESDKKAWIKIPSLSANTQKTIYTYYGNTSGFSATGGIISYSGGYTIHTFTSNGTFTPNGTGNVDVLIVAGGGGAGGGTGGGGGAGGMQTQTGVAVSASPYSIVVGTGGAGGQADGTNGVNGTNSSALGYTSIGGGYGAHAAVGANGGSGGGGGYLGSAGGSGTSGQGYAGGNGYGSSPYYTCGGGGGAGAVGSPAVGYDGGTGGAGSLNDYSGVATYYAGGGGGGTQGVNAVGGIGGGGVSINEQDGTSGIPGTGGGGGGAGTNSTMKGGAGGSGIVIIRYPTVSVIPASQSNGINTFVYWDDGSNTDNWIKTASADRDATLGNPIFSYKTPASNYMYKNIGLTTNSIIEYDVYSSGLGHFDFLINAAGQGQGFDFDTRPDKSNWYITNSFTSWTVSTNTGFGPIVNTWYRMKLILNGSTASAAYSTDKGSTFTNLAATFNFTNYGGAIGLNGDGVGQTNWDNIRVRKYSVIEPTPVVSQLAVDCGLRVSDGLLVIVLGCDPIDILTSPFKVSKGGSTYGVKLVDTTDPDASKIRIQTSAGTKSIIKLSSYTPTFGAGWSYKKTVTITENSGGSLTNFPVAITTDTASLVSAGKMRSDCGDIRFTDTDQTTLLSYFIESGCNTGSTKIWVEVPSISASSQKMVNLHYGNPSATSVASADNTFDIVNYTSLATYMNAYNEFWFYMSGSSVFFLKVKENGAQFVPGQDTKYTWTKLSATAHWDNPAGTSWYGTETGWNDYGTGAWNYWAPADCYTCYYHILEFVGNGRTGYYSYGYVYHADFVDITGAVTFNGDEGGSSSLVGPLVTYRIKHVSVDPTYVLGAEQ
ncbi:MAG: DUF2341 domain-containing protein [Minisyncoccota bacterium]